MKAYPQIPQSTGQSFRKFEAHVFDKLDGSNLRWEWARKNGWYKFGTRNRLFDETDEVFGGAIALFMERMAEPLEKVARDQRWQRCVAYTEFWGAKSFAGLHEPDDPKYLTLFDVDVYKQGLLDPRDFLSLYEGKVNTAWYFGKHQWTRGFVEAVRNEEIDTTFEGVVGKAMQGRKRIMVKAKTQNWINKIHEKYDIDTAAKLIAS